MPRKKVAPKKPPKETSKLWYMLCAVVFLAAGWLMGYYAGIKQVNPYMLRSPHDASFKKTFNFGNQTYLLDDTKLAFINGTYMSPDKTDNHTATIMTRSINGSQTRAAAILVDNTGGSGTFFYLVGAMKEGKTVHYSAPVLLGDRIKIVSVSADEKQEDDNGIITVTYLDRPDNNEMTVAPLEKKTNKYTFEKDGNLMEILD